MISAERGRSKKFIMLVLKLAERHVSDVEFLEFLAVEDPHGVEERVDARIWNVSLKSKMRSEDGFTDIRS